jgi:hypothetical protein
MYETHEAIARYSGSAADSEAARSIATGLRSNATAAVVER